MHVAMEYEHLRCLRPCWSTGRELAPGETIYSELQAEGGKLVRRDFSAEAWTGPSAGSLGWWKSVLPRRESQQMHWAPNDVILDLLEQLAGDPAQADMRYVLALLLVRRRVCRFVEGRGGEENRDMLVLFCPRREVEYKVSAIVPDQKSAQEIQNELARLLFAG
jgi:hypothetical protein